jgi:predicted ATPase
LENKSAQKDKAIIRTPDYRLRVFISSTLKEVAEEREAARQAIINLRLMPIMFESGARSHPSHELYRSYLSQSHIFIGIYWQSYGWVPEGEKISGLEDEFLLSSNIPRLIYIKDPKAEREPALKNMLNRIKGEDATSYKYFANASELRELVENDLALLLTEHFETARSGPAADEKHEPLTNVPIPRNPLIGREQELSFAKELLLRQDVGIITLIGPGGTGKSRLGLQIALDSLNDFEDGVYLVRLTPVRDPDLVVSTIADTLGIRETNDASSLFGKLKDYLREKQMLLLLDNFEQVLEAAPKIVELMETCPKLRLVVTSRAPLRVRGEKELFVPPLSVPLPDGYINLQNTSQYAAVELFIQRARSIRPDFAVTNENAPAIAEICHRLDGLPLAIELAAARIKMMTPHELLSKLEHRFDILRGGVRELPERQQTLRGAIDWSYELLNDSTKKLFRRLSVFVGGWTLDAAEAVCNLDNEPSFDIMVEMETLVDNSLLSQTQDADGQTRFGMLETIWEYANERLHKSNELDQIRRRHALYFLDFVRKVEPLIRSRERVKFTRKMRQEFNNIRAILEWSCSTGKSIEIGQQIAITLAWFWQSSMSISESSQWAVRLMEHADDSTPLEIHAGLLWGLGGFAWSQGDLPRAITNLAESVRLARMTDDKYLLANILIVRGLAANSAHEVQAANEMFEESIELLRALNEKWGQSLALSWMGDVALLDKDFERARQLHEQAIELAREQGDPWIFLAPLMSGGNTALITGSPEEAEAISSEAIGLLREIDDKWSLAWGLNSLGHAALQLGHLEVARTSFEECIVVARNIGNPGALIASFLGTAIVAAKRFQQSAVNGKEETASLINAMRLLGAIPSLNQNLHMFFWLGWWRDVYEQTLAQVRALTSEEAWEKAFTEGGALSMQQALVLAMQELQTESSAG